MLAVVVDGVDLRGIGEAAPRTIQDQRVVFPTVPKRLHDIDEFSRARVAVGVHGQIAVTVIRSRPLVIGRHDIPADPAVRRVVQRRKRARNVVGMRVGGGGARDKSNPARRRRHGGHDDRRVKRPARVGARIEGDRQRVGQKDPVEQPALRHARDLLVVLDLHVAERVAVGRPPARAWDPELRMLTLRCSCF